MSQKVKKQATNVSFSLSRWFRRISTTRPSNAILSVVVIGLSIFLLGGGLYSWVNSPAPYAYISSTQRFYFILTRSIGGSVGDQFSSETAISAVLYAFGITGLLVIYQSTKHAYNPRQANLMLLVGMALLFLAYVFLEVFMSIKFT
jgi:hypothetical protein